MGCSQCLDDGRGRQFTGQKLRIIVADCFEPHGLRLQSQRRDTHIPIFRDMFRHAGIGLAEGLHTVHCQKLLTFQRVHIAPVRVLIADKLAGILGTFMQSRVIAPP